MLGAERSRLNDKEQIKLNAHLAEHSRLVGENHVTFQRQQQIINIMVLLASAFAGLIFQNLDRTLYSNISVIFALIPVPFLILTGLHLRNDLKIHAIDEYIWLILRDRIRKLTGLTDKELWNYLQVAERVKFGFGFRLGRYYMLLSLVRYALPFFVVLGSLILYVYTDIYRTPKLGWLRWSAWSNWLFWADIIVTIIIFGIGGYLVKKSGQYIKGEKGAWITKGLLVNNSNSSELE